MHELLQNLVELNAILSRTLGHLAPAVEVTSKVERYGLDSYDPVDGITFI